MEKKENEIELRNKNEFEGGVGEWWFNSCGVWVWCCVSISYCGRRWKCWPHKNTIRESVGGGCYFSNE